MKYNGQTLKEWRERGKDKHCLYTNPQFIEAERFDFHLQPGSPAIGMGFCAIDISGVEVRSEEAKAAGK